MGGHRNPLDDRINDLSSQMEPSVAAIAPAIKSRGAAVLNLLPLGNIYSARGVNVAEFVERAIALLTECHEAAPFADCHGFFTAASNFVSIRQGVITQPVQVDQAVDHLRFHKDEGACARRVLMESLCMLARANLTPVQVGTLIGAFREEVFKVLPCHELILDKRKFAHVEREKSFFASVGWSSRGEARAGDFCLIRCGETVSIARIDLVEVPEIPVLPEMASRLSDFSRDLRRYRYTQL